MTARTQRIRSADGRLLEQGWMNQVVSLARLGGWRINHPPDNRPAGRTGRPQRVVGDTTGFPDLILMRGYVIIAAELKTDKGRLGPGQQDWLDAFAEVGSAMRRSVMRMPLAMLPEVTDGWGEPPSIEAVLWRPRDIEVVQKRLIPARAGAVAA